MYAFCVFMELYTFISLFFFNVPPTTEIYTLSLHDALPIYDLPQGSSQDLGRRAQPWPEAVARDRHAADPEPGPDRKSTRLNSSHVSISYAVFCLKKKK